MQSIAVLGLGKVGRLAAQLLVDSGFDVTGVDSAADPKNFPHDVAAIDVTNTKRILLRNLMSAGRAGCASGPCRKIRQA